MGMATKAIGSVSTAMGLITTASGKHSTSMGSFSKAIGDYSIAMGRFTTASGDYSTAMGIETTAFGIYSTAIGRGATASGEYSTAMGLSTTASGKFSTAIGKETTASGWHSTSMGENTTASSSSSIAMGSNTLASGLSSTAMGSNTEASEYYSTAMGWGTKAKSKSSLVIGQYNNSYGTKYLFQIGNGTGNTNRSNAFAVYKDGDVGIGAYAAGIGGAYVKLHVTDGTDASLNDHSGYFVLGNPKQTNMVFDNNEIMARKDGATSTLYLQHNGGSVEVGGSVVHSSDRRLKKDIKPLNYGLNEILQLKPKSYYWKNRKQNNKSFGLIAQDLQPIFKELVEKNDKDNMLSVNYTELIPVLINAIQEQQIIIEQQKNENNQQSANFEVQHIMLETQTKNYEKLLKRVEQLEQVNNQ